MVSPSMRSTNFVSTLSLFSFLRVSPLGPWQPLVRTAEDHFWPAHRSPFSAEVRKQQNEVLAAGHASREQSADVLREVGSGSVPTIVLGGLVPNSSEQVFLLRRFLLRSGDIYYFNYALPGFSLDLICAQIADLVAELAVVGQTPVLFGVSFGAGVIVEWLRRCRQRSFDPLLAGVVLVSPVTCVADLIAPGAAKPKTLIGRALLPFLGSNSITDSSVEKSRTVFLRLFEAGAQNKTALRTVMTAREAERLRETVAETIRGLTLRGSKERVQALARMSAPTDYFSPAILPLTTAPTLVLFAEREDAVMDANAPALFAFEQAHRAYFADSIVQRVSARSGGTAVQHASLIFHIVEFMPPLQSFYQRMRKRAFALAA